MLLLYNLLFSNKHNFVPLSHWDSSNSVGAFVPLFCTFWFQATGWVWMFSMSLWPGSGLKVWWTSKPFSSHRGPLAKVIWRPRLMSTLKTLAHAASAQVSSPENDVAKLKPGVGFSLSCLLLCYCVKHQTKSNLGWKGFIWFLLPGHSQVLRKVRARIQAGADADSWRMLHSGLPPNLCSVIFLSLANAQHRSP